MVYLTLSFCYGLVHGLGPDHLAAITAFGGAAGRDFRRVVFFAIRFAAGHAVVIAIAGLLGRFGHNLLSARWESAFEYSCGALLIGTGLLLLYGLLTGKVSVHQHFHRHPGSDHSHYHVHLASEHQHPATHQHTHGSLAVVLGALFAMGGVRSVILIVPMALAGTVGEALLRVGFFVVGIVIAMVGYAFITQRGLQMLTQGVVQPKWTTRILLASSYLVAAFCIVAGGMVIYGRLA